MDTGGATSPKSLGPTLRTRFGVARTLIGLVIVLWVVEAVDTVVLNSQLQGNGIKPRDLDGIDGVLWAPFLHSNFGHLISNTVPLFVLGGLVGLRGHRYWTTVTLATALLGGALVWLFAFGNGNHIGASGVAFGYFGALLGAAIKSRRPFTLAPALVAVFFYGGMLAGLVPRDSISWEGHLFGLLVGGAAGYSLTPRPAAKIDDGPKYAWELDEPWKVDGDEFS